MNVIKITTEVTRINVLEKNAKFLYGTNQSLSNIKVIVNLPSYTPLPPKILFLNKNTHHIISFKKTTHLLKYIRQWHIQRFPDPVYWFLCPNYVPKLKKNMQNNINFLNHIFNTNASTPSQTLNLSSPLKVVELKILYMSVSVTLDCLNVSQRIVFCINKYYWCAQTYPWIWHCQYDPPIMGAGEF